MSRTGIVVGKTIDGKHVVINKYDKDLGWSSMILTMDENIELIMELKNAMSLGGEIENENAK